MIKSKRFESGIFSATQNVKEDFKAYNHANAHIVFTQLNYTNGMIATGTNVREQD